MEFFVLRHKQNGRFYAGMRLGEDWAAEDVKFARKWLTSRDTEKFNEQFGDRYEVVPGAGV